MTWSPTAGRATPGPTRSTTPAPSWPSRNGKPSHVPILTCRSVWQTPEARMRTSTSPGPGSSTVMRSTSAGAFATRETTPCPSIIRALYRLRIEHNADAPIREDPGAPGQRVRREQRPERHRQQRELVDRAVHRQAFAGGRDRVDGVGRHADRDVAEPRDRQPLV